MPGKSPSKILLSNGCWIGKMSVHPSNWNTTKASLKIDWYIFYRFKDPLFKKQYPKGKLVPVRGMNEYKDLPQRQAATRVIMEAELTKLKVQGYNPITNTLAPLPNVDDEGEADILPETTLPIALQIAMKKMEADEDTLYDMENCLKFIQQAIIFARLNNMLVGMVSRKYVVKILESCGKVKDTWTAHTFNKYRTYLMSLFKIIVKVEALESNPVLEIEKKGTIRRIKETLSDEERKKVAKHLKKTAPSFYRYAQIFFHSGTRSKELFRVQVKDVNLEKQRYKIIVRKGKNKKEEYKTIKNIALPFWKQLMNDYDHETLEKLPEDYYIFSKGLKPGPVSIGADQINRRWKRHVKAPGKLGIKADFYSLKHLNTSEVVDRLNDADAAKLNAHEDTAMVVKIYDVKRIDRQHERLKKVNNKF